MSYTPSSSSSPAPCGSGTPRSASPPILTPSRKIKALLAQFHDSDSEDGLRSRSRTIGNAQKEGRTVQNTKPLEASGREDGIGSFEVQDEVWSNDEDDLLPVPARGKLAARMRGLVSSSHGSDSERNNGDNAYSRVKKTIMIPTSGDGNSIPQTGNYGNSEDEHLRPGPRRRLLKRRNSPVAPEAEMELASQSSSPLLSASPSPECQLPFPAGFQANLDLEDLPDNPTSMSNSRFLAVIEKPRRRRQDKEAAEAAKKEARIGQLRKHALDIVRDALGSDEDSDLSQAGAVNRMTQQSRPTRKASKKALEEMNRETQRMSRNMQLAHQARTKKKITKESLLARFDFPLPGAGNTSITDKEHMLTTANSAPASDSEGMRTQLTPPTSPFPVETSEKHVSDLVLAPAEVVEPTCLLQADSGQPFPTTHLDKGKGKGKGKSNAFEADPIASREARPGKRATKEPRPIRVRWSKEDAVIARAADSDSDLEIITSRSKARKFAAFESLPHRKAKETESHLALRSLANVTSVDKKRTAINAAELEASLRRAARLQAKREWDEKIEELKAKGVVIQTAEDRQKDQQEVEDLVERARQEAAVIQKREREIAKKNGTYAKDDLEDDDSDDGEDGEFQDEDNAQAEDKGAESEEDDDDDIEDDEGVERVATPDREDSDVIEDEAGEQGSNEASDEEESERASVIDNDEKVVETAVRVRKSRKMRIVSDDEEEETQESRPAFPSMNKRPIPVPRSARKVIPGLQMSDDLPMGLTQAFAATMADSQTEILSLKTQKQESLEMACDLPSPGFPLMPALARLESLDIVTDSQPASQTQPLDLDLTFSLSQRVPESLFVVAATQHSQIPFEPTQDAGYVLSPFAESRFDTPRRPHSPHSTIDTVVLPADDAASPILQRKGHLKRGRTTVPLEDGENADPNETSAFDVMRKAGGRNPKSEEAAFDKSRSNAKEIIDEAAEESEDEYAGLGGASDDEVGEENEEDRRMIDHDEKVGEGDEGKLAGLFADKERKQDEAAVSKLLKDITTGALRRKRGAADDLDLSDEEDATARKRESKRREFARMRRELLKDEAVEKIAKDRRKQAFLKSIEDREDVDDNEDDEDSNAEEPQEDDSQSQPAAKTVSVPLRGSAEPAELIRERKRPLGPSTADIVNRLPPSLRRTSVKAVTVANRKPATLAEIRKQVSFLIEEPDSQHGLQEMASSDDEDHGSEAYVNLARHLQDENADDEGELSDFIVDDSQPELDNIFKKPHLPTPRAPFAERRTTTNVVDRLSLLRKASASSSSSTTSKVAFFASTSSSNDNFKVPSLLRRATTNSSFGSVAGENVSATGVTTTTERGAADQEKDIVRKGAGRRRNAVNYHVKSRVVERDEKKSKIMKKAKAAGRKGSQGFWEGLVGGGGSWA